MNTIDLIIFIAYCLLILSVGLFVSCGKKGDERDAGDYFLAGRGLAWWAIGASIIASNISAEQFVGMSGSWRRRSSPCPSSSKSVSTSASRR